MTLFAGLAACNQPSFPTNEAHSSPIVLSDGDVETLKLTETNLSLNGLQDRVKLSVLRWDNLVEAQNMLKTHFGTTMEIGASGFDIIVGSDCLYAGMNAVKQLFAIVNVLLKGGLNDKQSYQIAEPLESTVANDCNEGNETDDVETVSSSNFSTPVFILGYERRLGGGEVDIAEMLDVALHYGLRGRVVRDYVVDIFGNETEEQTLFWEQCVYVFTRT